MSSPNGAASDLDSPPGRKIAAGELFLLCCSLLSLVTSCVLWSAHKQVWMDEIFTWKEVSDRSLWHLYYAIQHGADGGQPLFYTTAWLWAKVFGTGILTLRLYSDAAMCGALLVTWWTIRRFYGVWATALGVLAFWGTSGVLLDQNAEARFYGLYMLMVAITFHVYVRLVSSPAPTRWLLAMALLSQAALVSTHVLGLIYSGLVLLALILFDAAQGRLRFKVYLCYVAGWLALLLWLPAIQSSMAAGKPHGWIAMPTLTDLRSGYLFADALPWLRLLKRHSLEAGFRLVRRTAELVIYVPLAGVLILELRKIFRSGWRVISSPRGSLLLVAYLLLLMPALLFALSHLVTPVFVTRYFLPSGIGLAVILAATADLLGSDKQAPRSWMRRFGWIAVLLFLLISPVLTVLALGPISLSWDYLDIQRLEKEVPADSVVIAAWQEDFVKLMRLAHNPEAHYYYLLDWPSALSGPRAFVLDYHLMGAYRNNGYYSGNIQNSNDFLCSHANFLVLDAPNSHISKEDKAGSPDFQRKNWFDMNVRARPQFAWKVIDTFDAPEVKRTLIAVQRNASLSFCKLPE